MNATDLLRHQLNASKGMLSGLLADMQDAPLAFPTVNGGNHPTWIAGHVAYSESNLIHHMLQGETNPLIDWKSIFGSGSQPSDDASQYPPLSELLAKWDEVRSYTLSVLDSLTDEDLDRPAASPPPGREEFFDTYGKIFSMAATHPLMHFGQAADARRAAGRLKLMA